MSVNQTYAITNVPCKNTTPMQSIRQFLLAAVLILAASVGQAATVTVFAAASLTDALKQIATDYEKSSGDKIVFNFGSSGTLARQIEAGAPADMLFSADEAKVVALAAAGLLVADSRKNLLGNSLVIITAPDSTMISAPSDLTNASVKRIALGDIKSVPAGTYAKSYLEKLGCWPVIESKVIPCETVRAVLAAVESGNVDAGIVYKTDAATSKQVKVAFAVPAADGPKIIYSAALVSASPQATAANKFLGYLAHEDAGVVFGRCGFIVLSPPKN